MGLGVLETNVPGHVPGTVLLDQQAANSGAITNNLKHDKKNPKILLAPQPSEDPNDPLNWSSSLKYLVCFILFLGTIVHSASTAFLLNAGTVQIAKELRVPINKMVKLSGYYTLAAAAMGPPVATLARKYGKRPVFVFSSLFAIVGCIIGECSQGYNSLLAARLIQGMAQTSYETLVYSSVGDQFFVHERGPPMAIGVFVVNAIANCVQIVAGTITTNLGWRWNFHILAPFAAVQTIGLILFVPETTFRRAAIYNIDTAGSEDEDYATLAAVELKATPGQKDPELTEVERVTTSQSLSYPPRRTWVQRMAVYNGTFVEDSVWKILLSFPVILLNLGAAFAIFASGLVLAWYAASAISLSVLLPAPPYQFTSSTVGHASTGPLIGAILATIFMGVVSDPVIKFLTRRNMGVYEPEFQLPLTLIGALCAIPGMVGLGYAVARGLTIYFVCFVWGVLSFGLILCSTTYFNYALSAYRDYASEIFIMSSSFRGFFGYGMANFIVPWLEREGVGKVFGTIGGILAAIVILTGPMYIGGKKYRQFWHHHNLYKDWHLETDKSGVSEA